MFFLKKPSLVTTVTTHFGFAFCPALVLRTQHRAILDPPSVFSASFGGLQTCLRLFQVNLFTLGLRPSLNSQSSQSSQSATPFPCTLLRIYYFAQPDDITWREYCFPVFILMAWPTSQT